MGVSSHEFMMDRDRDMYRDPDYLNWLSVTAPTSKGKDMNIDDAFPSKFLKAGDLQGRTISAVIRDVTLEKMGDDNKAVMWFMGKEKGLTLNVTKKEIMKDAFGPDTNLWRGRSVWMRPGKTMYAGKMVDCIDMGIVTAEPPAQQHAQAQQPQYVPPVQQQYAPPAAPPQQYAPPQSAMPAQQPVQHAPPTHEPVFDDEIPF